MIFDFIAYSKAKLPFTPTSQGKKRTYHTYRNFDSYGRIFPYFEFNLSFGEYN